MKRKIKRGDWYHHFKGGVYLVLGVGKHTETSEKFVIYIGAATGDIYLRPYDMFLSAIDVAKYPSVKQEFRMKSLSPRHKKVRQAMLKLRPYL